MPIPASMAQLSSGAQVGALRAPHWIRRGTATFILMTSKTPSSSEGSNYSTVCRCGAPQAINQLATAGQ